MPPGRKFPLYLAVVTTVICAVQLLTRDYEFPQGVFSLIGLITGAGAVYFLITRPNHPPDQQSDASENPDHNTQEPPHAP